MTLLSTVFLLFITFQTCHNVKYKNYFNTTQEISDNFVKNISKFLEYYKTFHHIFYIDINTAELFEKTRELIINNNETTMTVLNNDKSINQDKFKRAKVINAIHIIYSNNISYWNLLNNVSRLKYRDVVLFIADNIDLKYKIIEHQVQMIKLAGKILLFENINDTILLFQVCFYCGYMENKFIEINVDANGDIYPDRFINLHGHVLKMVYISNYPFIYCNDKDNQGSYRACKQLNGIESHMIRLISRKMNFTYTANELEENRTYFSMLHGMIAHKTDLAFGAISMTLNRRGITEFTTQYHVENYNLLYSSNLYFIDLFEKFTDPFSSALLWVLFLVSYILIAIVLYFMQFKENSAYKHISLKNCFWILFQVQLEQAVSGDAFKSASRRTPCWGAMLALWCGGCMVLCAAYKGATLSALVSPSRNEPESLEQLVKTGYEIAASNKSIDIITDLLNVSNPVYKKTMQTIAYGTSMCEVFAEVVKSNRRVAMLNEWSTIQFQIRKLCPEPDPKKEKSLRIARRPVRNAGHAWATPLGAPYKQAIDFYLGLILSGGLYAKWTRDHTYEWTGGRKQQFRLSREFRGDDMRAVTLNLNTFIPLFLIYSLGMTVAIICFILELLRYNYLKRNIQIFVEI